MPSPRATQHDRSTRLPLAAARLLTRKHTQGKKNENKLREDQERLSFPPLALWKTVVNLKEPIFKDMTKVQRCTSLQKKISSCAFP